MDEMVLNQDNLSEMLLETNGNHSISKQTKHIRVRYFFIKGRLHMDDSLVKHCATNEMMGDHFTRQLQGSHFQKFRAKIQGIPNDTSAAMMGWDRAGEMVKEKFTSLDGPGPQECAGTE
jgi:hypothetical protein